jgi:hypothetical protein
VIASYLELKSDDASALRQKIIEAGLPGVEEYSTGDFFYFQAPGGQVIRIALANKG